jgi:serine/threonine-protein kinase
MLLRRGQVLGARYEVLAPLARGGMGTVFRAKDRVTGDAVAVKVLSAEWAARRDMKDRFRSEMLLAQKVRHHNVCRILDCGEDGARSYIVTELIPGVDLKRLLGAAGALPTDHAFDGAIQIARGLQAVHDAGIVHRDVKSPNVVVDRAGRFRLLDFDLAERIEDAAGASGGSVLGTPEYMSPEQARGGPIDFRSDVYSLGIVVYALFTGEVPFRGETPLATIEKQLNEAPPLDGRALPPALVPVLKKALAKRPERRYARARSVVEALRLARSASGLEDEPPADRRRTEGVPALLGALNPRDATVRLDPELVRAALSRASHEAMAVLVAALMKGDPEAAEPDQDPD